MKKVFSILILLVVCSLFFSCGAQHTDVSTESSDVQGIDTSLSTSDKSENQDGGSLNGGGTGELAMTTRETYDEYLEFIESDRLINNFVHFETVSNLGNFIMFTTGGHSTSDYGEYWYIIKDANDFELFLKIEHSTGAANEQESTSNVIFNVNTADLRRLDTSDSGIYEKDGICYKYFNGALHEISWEMSGIRCKLYSTSSNILADYPLEHNAQTTVATLLNTQTAFDTLNDMFELSVD